MAELAKGKLRNKIPAIAVGPGRKAGRAPSLLEPRILQKLEPDATQRALLQEIPGVNWTLAAVIIAELGIDMSVFQSVSQLASWAGVCPERSSVRSYPSHSFRRNSPLFSFLPSR
jgi:hypothetical protein